MGTVYVSFGVPRMKKISRFFKKRSLCSTLVVIHIKKSIEPKITIKINILVSPSFVNMYFFDYHRHLMVLRLGLSFDNS